MTKGVIPRGGRRGVVVQRPGGKSGSVERIPGPTLTATDRAVIEEWLRSEEAERRLAEALCANFDLGHRHEQLDNTLAETFHAVAAHQDARAILAALRGDE